MNIKPKQAHHLQIKHLKRIGLTLVLSIATTLSPALKLFTLDPTSTTSPVTSVAVTTKIGLENLYYISYYSCYPNLSCLDSSLLVLHPCRHNMGVGVGSMSNLVSQFWVLRPKSMGKVRTIIMISVVNTKAKSRGFMLVASTFSKTSSFFGVGTGTSTCCNKQRRTHNQKGFNISSSVATTEYRAVSLAEVFKTNYRKKE
ncbi:hypothetical protein H5410_047050 [Solanum commersonii]|uniref:Uncharacterized protein n=1 Tax=Solanum commersonii TaxID=4109 RepID=A0A9J5XI37_SOLCO|nr:hypothetical protein H5410_047050 [Solanum commersonii]